MSTKYNFTGEERLCIREAGETYRGLYKNDVTFWEHLSRKLQCLMYENFNIFEYPYLEPFEVYLEWKGLEKYWPYASEEEEFFHRTGQKLEESEIYDEHENDDELEEELELDYCSEDYESDWDTF